MRRSMCLAAALASASAAAYASETVTYGYDALGRLTAAARAGTINNGVRADYHFDQAGNRTRMIVAGSSGTASPPPGTPPPPSPGSILSFEQPEVGSSFAYNPTVAGFTFNTRSGVAGNNSPWGFVPAPDGDQVAFLQNVPGETPGVITHSATGLTSGGSYRLTFSLAQRPGYAQNAVTVRVDGVLLGTFRPDSTSFAQVTTSAFQASGSTASIEFSASSADVDGASGLDAVAVVTDGAAQDSFETPDLGNSFAYNPSLAGFTFASRSGIAGNGSAWGFAAPPDGDQVAFLQNIPGDAPGVITRNVTGLTSGASYQLSFALAQRPNYAPNAVRVRVDGVSIGTFTPASTSFERVTTNAFNASSSTATIEFSASSASVDGASGLDVLKIVSAPSKDSFEAPELGSSFAYNPSLAGFAFSPRSGIAGNGSAWNFASAPDGDQVAFLQNVPGDAPGVITRNVTGLTSGASYQLSFALAQRPGYASNAVTIRVDGATIGTFTPASTSFDQVTTNAFNASSSTAKIEFSASSASVDGASGLDILKIVPASSKDSFEAPELGSSFAYNPSLAGFTFSARSGIAGNGSAWGFAPAPDGDQVAFLQNIPGENPGSIARSITGLTSGAFYQLRFLLARRPGYDTHSVTVRGNGEALGTFTASSTNFEVITTRAFQASGSTATIEFSGVPSVTDAASGLDMVEIISTTAGSSNPPPP